MTIPLTSPDLLPPGPVRRYTADAPLDAVLRSHAARHPDEVVLAVARLERPSVWALAVRPRTVLEQGIKTPVAVQEAPSAIFSPVNEA